MAGARKSMRHERDEADGAIRQKCSFRRPGQALRLQSAGVDTGLPTSRKNASHCGCSRAWGHGPRCRPLFKCRSIRTAPSGRLIFRLRRVFCHHKPLFGARQPEDLVDEDPVGFQYQLGHASHSIKATRWSGSAVPANSKRSNFHPRSLALPGSQTLTTNMAHRSSPCDHPSVSARNRSGSNSAGCQPSSFRARQGNDLASRKIRSVDWFVYLGFIHSIDCCLYG